MAENIEALADALLACQREREEARKWVTDLQDGMYVNCVYCGFRYGNVSEVPCSMSEILKQHIEQCPQHPMSALKAERDRLVAEVERLRAKLTCPECGQEIHAAHHLECSHDRKDG